MAEPITILGIAGSLRKESYNRGALRAAQKLCPEGVKLEIFELEGIPLYSQDQERSPAARVAEFKARIRGVDAILIATPEYNYSVPGVLKNAIDCASRPYGDSAWDGKPVALMSASVGAFGGMRAQYHLRQSFVFLNMDAVLQPEVAIGNAQKAFDEHSNLTDETSKKLIRQLLEKLVQKARNAKLPVKAAA
jgi:chromate reductase, NAD(P)H dehydrogenase (quinone)